MIENDIVTIVTNWNENVVFCSIFVLSKHNIPGKLTPSISIRWNVGKLIQYENSNKYTNLRNIINNQKDGKKLTDQSTSGSRSASVFVFIFFTHSLELAVLDSNYFHSGWCYRKATACEKTECEKMSAIWSNSSYPVHIFREQLFTPLLYGCSTRDNWYRTLCYTL